MPAPRRLPSRREVPWGEVKRRSSVLFAYLVAGWEELTADERREVQRLLAKSRGRLRNLSRDEARRLGGLAARASAAASRAGGGRRRR
ncbi:MAG: hypothetical protein QOE28_2806 [Solirubrobacteraceae bacterium]|jgi:hypothetical protein|nr:hypothetical protein [Solirubrobacteraceae bacterium]